MAFTEFYCQTTGSNLNSGSTTSDTATYTSINGGWNSTTGVFTPVSGDPSATVLVGDFASIFLDAATLAVFIGRVTAVDSTTITVSTTAKSGTAPTTVGTGITCKVGGAWKGPNSAEGFPFGFVSAAMINIAGNPIRVNFKSGINYNITGGLSHSIAGPTVFQGYAISPGDGGKATIDGTNAIIGFVMITFSQALNTLADFIISNNGPSGSTNAISSGIARCFYYRVVAYGVRGAGFSLNAGVTAIECEAYNCNLNNNAGSGGFLVSGTCQAALINCISHDNTGNGFAYTGATGTSGAMFVNCIADTNSDCGFRSSSTGPVSIINCSANNNVSHGISAPGAGLFIVRNCLLVGNGTGGTGYGISGSGIIGLQYVENCAFYDNETGETTGTQIELGSITLSSNPFVDATNGDFDLNNTTSAGAACRGTGRGAFLQDSGSYSATTLAYPDVGAVQHQDTGGGGSAGGFFF